jgi:hypothetical protein
MESVRTRHDDKVSSSIEHQQAICSGYGACSKSGCNCKGFEGSGGTCANRGCGHAYEDHW